MVWSTRRYSLRKVGSAAVRIHTIRSSFWKPLLSVLFGSSSHIFLLQDSGLAKPLKAITSTNAQDLDPIIFILKLNVLIYDTEIHFTPYLFKKDTFKHKHTALNNKLCLLFRIAFVYIFKRRLFIPLWAMPNTQCVLVSHNQN